MKLLFLAPQPFFQERGTPIAVKLALEALSARLIEVTKEETTIDLLVYREGKDVNIPGVTVHRVYSPKWLNGIRPGISCKKLLADLIFFIHTFQLIYKARRNQYKVIHAVEESVFIAWLAKVLFKIPYVYDMDSSLAMQLTEKWWWFSPISAILNFFERTVIRGASAVAPVCDALEALAHRHGASHTTMLRDVSLLPQGAKNLESHVDLRRELQLGEEQPLLLYVGNLESYQGIDLLLESFQLACSHPSAPHLAVVGGNEDSIAFYRKKASELGCQTQVSFTGPRPVATLKALLLSSDIVVSPRTKGNNTPMKLYSYLHCGKALLATDLPTHTQIVDGTVAVLAAPNPRAFSEGMILLLSDPGLRREIGERARVRAERLYTVDAFEKQLLTLYSHLGTRVLRKPNDTHSVVINGGA
jgi:glycosyltransferase involved in cell wall biosynthesis